MAPRKMTLNSVPFNSHLGLVMDVSIALILVKFIIVTGLISASVSASEQWWNNTTLATFDPKENQIQRWGNETQRNGKFFPLFTLVRFSNEPCRTNNEDNGVCYTRPQCQALGGIAAGTCATGLGVCCQFFSTCGSIVNQNQTFFRNPDYPNKFRPASGSDVCQIRIRRQIGTCQLRLNFLKFDVDGPNTAVSPGTGGTPATTGVEAGVCKNDMFSAAGAPSLCGNMDGQHMYLEFGSSDTITLNILLGSNADRDREWNIELLMIPCRSITRAPSGCLQYFQGISGQVSSFNFLGSQHMANLGYSICVRVEEGMRSIDWSACNVGDVKFSGPTPTTPLNALPTTPTIPTACSANNVFDYIVIPGGVYYPLYSTTAANYPLIMAAGQSFTDRFCDIFFAFANAFVRTTVKPFTLSVKTDGLEQLPPQAMDASAGFCFKWQQSPS